MAIFSPKQFNAGENDRTYPKIHQEAEIDPPDSVTSVRGQVRPEREEINRVPGKHGDERLEEVAGHRIEYRRPRGGIRKFTAATMTLVPLMARAGTSNIFFRANMGDFVVGAAGLEAPHFDR